MSDDLRIVTVRTDDTTQVQTRDGGTLIGPSARALVLLNNEIMIYKNVRRQGLTYYFWGKR